MILHNLKRQLYLSDIWETSLKNVSIFGKWASIKQTLTVRRDYLTLNTISLTKGDNLEASRD